jgi:hypothetical protein
VDQRALGELAERAAAIAERAELAQWERGAQLSRLIAAAAREHGYAPWAMTSMVAGEWARLGIRTVPRGTELHQLAEGARGR